MYKIMMRKIALGALCVILLTAINADADSFDRIRDDLNKAACVSLEFISIIESDIFESVDSVNGTAYLSGDGRYFLQVGEDIYLYDLTSTYSYSAENNQVVIESVGAGGGVSEEISFITNLSELYNSRVIHPDSVYHLTKLPGLEGDYPDSLTLVVDRRLSRLAQMEYYDINEELNRVIILRQDLFDHCLETRFKPAFPDSVERVKF